VLSASIRLFVRRRRWGRDARAVARRARLFFGAPWPYQWLCARGLNVRSVDEQGVRGEWVEPAGAGAGVIFYLHGGGFYLCDPATHRLTTKKLAKLTGGRCYSVRYRLAPQHPFPAALLDLLVSYLTLLYPPPGAFHEAVRPETLALAGDR